MKSWLLSLGSIVLGGALLVAAGCSTEPKQYTVIFKQAGQADVVFTVDEGSDFTKLPTPKSVTGYTVVWDRTTIENVTENIVVNAVATANEYTITYAQEDGVTLDAYTQTVVYDANYELKTPEKDLYVFDGWYNGNTLVDQSGVWKIASDVTLTAMWTEEAATFYEVKFVQVDGTEESVQVKKGTTLQANEIPTCKQITGYTVTWEVTDFSTVTSGRIVNAVKTAKTYTISYQSEEGVTLPSEVTVTYGQAYTLKDPTHSDRHMYFTGWLNAETGEKFASSGVWEIDGDVTLKADWIEVDSNDWTDNH